jgi:hypothetical protein
VAAAAAAGPPLAGTAGVPARIAVDVVEKVVLVAAAAAAEVAK